ncbi:MAG: glucokinase [Sphingomicrobium sp.]
MFSTDIEPARSLLIDASREGLLRFAIIEPLARDIRNVQEIDVHTVPTFTDALQSFAHENNLKLRGLNCIMAVASVTSEENVAIGRTRWMIARVGLGAIFGRPVTIINNVAAKAWALDAGTATLDDLRGGGVFDLSHRGRYIIINVDQGVGCALIEVDNSGEIRVSETEAGHMDFPPLSDVEATIAHAIRGSSPLASWEKMLVLDRHSSAWSAAGPKAMRGERQRFLASILGRFAVNLVNAYGAWQGVLVTGGTTANLLKGIGRTAFDEPFQGRRHFSRLIAACPAWHVRQKKAVLTGALQYLHHGMLIDLPAAA